MKAKGGSKNNIANRGASARVKMYQGKEVLPIKLKIARSEGVRGQTFMGAKFKGTETIVCDQRGNYIPYASIL